MRNLHTLILVPLVALSTTSQAQDVLFTYKAGADAERLPKRVLRDQSQEEGLFTELGLKVGGDFSDQWKYYVDTRAFGATSQISSSFDDVDTGRTEPSSSSDSYVQLRQAWVRFGGLTDYPDEHLTLGLQRITATSPLWWDTELESLVWRFQTTRFEFQTGVGERLDTYRSNNDLSAIDEDRLRVFADGSFDWTAYHQVFLRFMFTDQDSNDLPSDVQTGAPDGANGQWLWYGIGAGSNWMERRSASSWAYNVEWIGLSGESDFTSGSGITLEDHDISAWALDIGARYDFKSAPASFGMTYSQGSGGFDQGESNMFVQTGLHTNRGRFVGNKQYLFRYNEALRADLTNLTHAAMFASYTFERDLMLAGQISKFGRDDEDFPIYRRAQPLDMNTDSDDVGYGIDVSLRHSLNNTYANVPVQYWRIRGSGFFPGDAFDNENDGSVYRVVLEVVGAL
ncbi:alginate export family protein [Echinimonas agarilytica]|uniref:Alginate export family protein n=1 Tax=Echinimonas agarilytica TaxID=1215918 RepID=A0AA41W8X8_9GAMM|nr:alginate export family protein [Echinimonas agarilytica]MCM2681225.1 alginate export family protein [Echinimonas agarilytica]